MRRKSIYSLCLTLAVSGCLLAQQEVLYVEQIHSAQAFSAPVARSAVSTKINLLAALSSDKSIRFYEIPSLKEKSSALALTADMTTLSFSASGNTLALGGADGQVHLFDVLSRTIVKSLPVHAQRIHALIFQDEGWVFTAGVDKTMTITDAIAGTTIGSLPSFAEEVTALAIPADAKNGAAGLSNGQVQIFSIGSMTTTLALGDAKSKITALTYSADGKFLAAGCEDGGVLVWNAEFGLLQFQYAHAGSVSAVAFDPKMRWIVSTSSDNTMKFYDLGLFTNIKTVQMNNDYGTSAFFSDEETLLIGTNSGSVQRWKVSLAPPDSTNPGIVMERPMDGTVTANAFAREFELRGLIYDDYDVKEASVNGTPVPLTAASAEDAAKVPAGMKSVKRFSMRMKLDSVGINPFKIHAMDKAQHSISLNGEIRRLSSEQAFEIESPMNNSETGAVSLPIRFRTWFDISSYSITSNMVDIVSGQEPAGISTGEAITENIPIVLGYNQIQISITSKTGDKFSKILSVNRTLSAAPSVSTAAGPPSLPVPASAPGTKKIERKTSGPQRWAVIVGVSEYLNPGIPSLKYADKDAEAMANFLRTPEGGGYDSEHMRVLLNKDATLTNLRDALINFLNQAIDMDLVLIYFAGHGAPEPARPQNIYLLTADSDPAALGTSAFPMWDIQTVLARYINAKRVVVFSDACHSGNISVNFATRGVGVTEQNLVNQYLSDLSKSKEGVVVFTASASGEVSQEFPEMAHGVFTYYLLEGARGKADYDNDFTVTINELMQYVEEQVKRKTRGAQNPTRSQTDYDKEMTISVLPH